MDRNAQTIKLKDGRILGFAEYGDPNGKPLFYFHGWPATRLNAAIYNTLAKKLHVRIIAPDRPGFGISDFQKGRTLIDWPDDVIALADHLKIKTFAVMGVSGGGPYAAVCAYKIPHRLTKTGIVVGLGLIRGPDSVKGLLWIGKIGWLNFGKHPWLRKSSTYVQYLNYKYNLFSWMNHYTWGKADRNLLADPALSSRLTETIRDAFRSGYKGPELDLKLYTTEWRFRLQDIRSHVYMWYGEMDQNVSLAMGKHYGATIPNSKLIVYPNEGHLVSITHAEEILKTLVN